MTMPQTTGPTQTTGPSRATGPLMRRHPRLGSSSLEVIVSLTLLTSVLSLSVPLVVRHGRLLASHRSYRLAMDELSNQLERLTAMPESKRQEALNELAPSQFIEARLPGIELRYDLEPIDFGQRLILLATWDERQRRAAPASMAAWIVPIPGQTPEDEAS